MVIDQLVTVPTVKRLTSSALNVQVPLGVPYKEENAETFETLLVAPTLFPASAASVPVNGAFPLTGVVVALLIVVLVKLFPDPPSWFTRFSLFPLGCFYINNKITNITVGNIEFDTHTVDNRSCRNAGDC